MFKKILKLIQNANLPREERDSIFKIIAESSENSIAREVGTAAKDIIMEWWYRMCDVRAKERKGG